MSKESESHEDVTKKLVNAAQIGDLLMLEDYIDKHNITPDLVDENSCSLLHWSAINNRTECVKYLLRKCANVNLVGGANRETPLQWAVRNPKALPLVALLLDHGASLEHKSAQGLDALFIAVKEGLVDTAFVLLQRGANVNTYDFQGDTPLYYCVKNDVEVKTIEMQRLLCAFEASVAYRAKDRNNVLHLLALHKSDTHPFDFFRASLLLRRGLSQRTEFLSAKNKNDLSPIQLATKNQNRDFIRFMFDAIQFNSFPFWFPIFTTATAYCLGLLLIQRLGWLYGLLSIIPLFFFADYLTQSYLPELTSRTDCGLAWGVIVSTAAGFFLLLRPFCGNVWTYIGCGVTGLIVGLLYFTATTAPVHLFGHSDHAKKSLAIKMIRAMENQKMKNGLLVPTSDMNDSITENPGVRLCTTCLVDKNLVSIHCRKCNMCVVHLDHHCTYVCNCIGRGNRRLFVLFLLSAAVGCFLFFLVSVRLQFSRVLGCVGGEDVLFNSLSFAKVWKVQGCLLTSAKYRILPLITLVALLVAVWLFLSFFQQLSAIASETTTFEMLRRQNYGRWPLTWRGLKNIFQFFYSGHYSVERVSGAGEDRVNDREKEKDKSVANIV